MGPRAKRVLSVLPRRQQLVQNMGVVEIGSTSDFNKR